MVGDYSDSWAWKHCIATRIVWCIRGKIKEQTQKWQNKLENDWNCTCRELGISQGIEVKFTQTSLHIPVNGFHGHSDPGVLWHGVPNGQDVEQRAAAGGDSSGWSSAQPLAPQEWKAVGRGSSSTDTGSWKATRQRRCFWAWEPCWEMSWRQGLWLSVLWY